MAKKYQDNQSGAILIAIMIIMPFFLLIAAAYLQFAAIGYKIARSDQFRTHAQFAADAGIDYSIEQIHLAEAWGGTGGQIELHNDGNVKTTFEATVATPDPDNKIITATGRTFSPANSSSPTSDITINVVLKPVRTGDYSIVSGVGGLEMKNSAWIANGQVYVNGKLSLKNSAHIGSAIIPVDVKVAHHNCPAGGSPGPTYPRLCAAGEDGEPIDIKNFARIYGNVRANNQTTGTGMLNSGLCASTNLACDDDYPVPALSLPDYDRNAQKAAVPAGDSTRNITGAAAGCGSGSRTWKNNTKITGNVTVGSVLLPCVVTVEGNVWITGNLTVRGNSIIKVAEGLTEPPVIMIDGSAGLSMKNPTAGSFTSNSGLIGFRLITFGNSTGDPDAAISGTNLYNSQNQVTIEIDNVAAVGLQTEFYARWSKIIVGDTVGVGAIAGQTVELKNGVAITLGTSLTGFGDTVWVFDSYRRDF